MHRQKRSAITTEVDCTDCQSDAISIFVSARRLGRAYYRAVRCGLEMYAEQRVVSVRDADTELRRYIQHVVDEIPPVNDLYRRWKEHAGLALVRRRSVFPRHGAFPNMPKSLHGPFVDVCDCESYVLHAIKALNELSPSSAAMRLDHWWRREGFRWGVPRPPRIVHDRFYEPGPVPMPEVDQYGQSPQINWN